MILEYKKVVLISYLAHREGLPTADGEIRELSDTNANAATTSRSAGVQCDGISCVDTLFLFCKKRKPVLKEKNGTEVKKNEKMEGMEKGEVVCEDTRCEMQVKPVPASWMRHPT